MTTYYIDPTGSAGSGTFGSPFNTRCRYAISGAKQSTGTLKNVVVYNNIIGGVWCVLHGELASRTTQMTNNYAADSNITFLNTTVVAGGDGGGGGYYASLDGSLLPMVTLKEDYSPATRVLGKFPPRECKDYNGKQVNGSIGVIK